MIRISKAVYAVCISLLLFVPMMAQNTSGSGSSSNTHNPNGSGSSASASSSSSSSASGAKGNTLPGPVRVEPGTPTSVEMFMLTNASNAINKPPAKGDAHGYYSIPDDPTKTRIYTLDNGLKVYLSVNKTEPRIQTYIAVKAGSNSDPRETTGLAHYLEHMMFKGTNTFGTDNWNRESLVLQSIAHLYEEHRKETDPEKKKAIYAEIDKLSQQAATFAIPNEYDKMISSLGAKGTNAYTSKERTVYVNDIPSNELEKWLVVESERFRTCVLRLFQTELETVYEEYNISQDRDGSKVYETLYRALFPTTPYGTQTTIGEGEHLKNPSMNNIMAYFYNFYVPNNMAICLSGDIDYDKTIAMIDKYFGTYVKKPVGETIFKEEAPITEIQKREVLGNEAAEIDMAYRMPGANTKEAMLTDLVSGMLFNQQAGLFDLDLNQAQKVLYAGAYSNTMKQYTVLGIYVDPREGQSLEECEQLVQTELQKLRTGDFDDWLIQAVVNDYKLSRIRSFETNSGRAGAFVSSFILNQDWGYFLHYYDMMSKVTKQEVIEFANTYLKKDNYAIVYKRQAPDPNVKRVEKPAITPVEANRDKQSKFVEDFMRLPSVHTEPEFVQFSDKIKSEKLTHDVPFSYINNSENQYFQLYYLLDMGVRNDPELGLALDYVSLLGTDDMSAAELQKELFRYGLTLSFSADQDRTYLQLSGLGENFEKGVQIFEKVLHHAKADNKAYKEYVDGIVKDRNDAKTNKGAIFNGGMLNYAKYGPVSPMTDILSEKQMRNILPQDLTQKFNSILHYKHEVFYYGNKPMQDVVTLLNTQHITNENLADYPPAKKYPELETKETKVLFVDYPMKQTQIMFVSKDIPLSMGLLPQARIFNEYFGSGLSSIVFQEIRETKGLAYSAYSFYTTPGKKDEAHYVRAFVGCQADKMPEAIDAMMAIMKEMPRADDQFNNAVSSVEKQIESERIKRASIFWTYKNAKDMGIDYDYRRDIYLKARGITLDDLEDFYNAHISGRNYTILVMGDKTQVNMDYLNTLGPVRELTLEEIFGY